MTCGNYLKHEYCGRFAGVTALIYLFFSPSDGKCNLAGFPERLKVALSSHTSCRVGSISMVFEVSVDLLLLFLGK